MKTLTLYASSEYMDFICNKLKEQGQLWAYANVGWYQQKKLWRIK